MTNPLSFSSSFRRQTPPRLSFCFWHGLCFNGPSLRQTEASAMSRVGFDYNSRYFSF
ncbi:hypothetical protein [Citrobacter koseri]|uniref:hypothetical protein n=1 Tax=Citrobacter koseri TaxID=545 RepID=UPI00192BF9A9|nr:hypothetical protein [Citrobacter koseri]MBL4565101.1 hypothetical protein [Citrobacter koseri]